MSWQLKFLTVLPLLELDSEAAPSCWGIINTVQTPSLSRSPDTPSDIRHCPNLHTLLFIKTFQTFEMFRLSRVSRHSVVCSETPDLKDFPDLQILQPVQIVQFYYQLLITKGPNDQIVNGQWPWTNCQWQIANDQMPITNDLMT